MKDRILKCFGGGGHDGPMAPGFQSHGAPELYGIGWMTQPLPPPALGKIGRVSPALGKIGSVSPRERGDPRAGWLPPPRLPWLSR